MRNIRRAIIVPVLLLVGALLVVFNSQAEILATVYIHNTAIVSQENNKLKIAFDISNGENIQPGIRYGVKLDKIGGEGAIVVDEKAFPEVITLGPNETVQREVDYVIPSYLKGNFEVWVTSQTENGMPLGQGLADKVEYSGGESIVEIFSDSCTLRVEGEADKTYALSFGVDTAPSENLILSCKVKNGFSTGMSITPSFSTYYRNAFGDLISSVKQDSFKLAAGEEKRMDFTVPKATKPQGYDATLVFLGNNSKEISNKITAHYVIQGRSASIQNVRFDKNSYLQGETAQVSFLWSGNADSFQGSRKSAVTEGWDEINISEIMIKNGNSNACSDLHQEKIVGFVSDNISSDVSITKDCPDPVAHLTIKDKDGNVLDSVDYSLNGQSSSVPDQPDVTDKVSSSMLKKMLFGIVAFLTVLSLILIVRSKMKSKGGINITILFLILGSFLFLGAQQASAGCGLGCAFSVSGESEKCEKKLPGNWSHSEYSVSIDNLNSNNDGNYFYGDTMRISASVGKLSECGNGVKEGALRVRFDEAFHVGVDSKNNPGDWEAGDWNPQKDATIGDATIIYARQTSGNNNQPSLTGHMDFVVQSDPGQLRTGNRKPGGAPGQHYIDIAGGVYYPLDFPDALKDILHLSAKKMCDHFALGMKNDNTRRIYYNVLPSPPPPPPPPPPKHNVNVGINGSGSGWVDGSGVSCGSGRSTCSISIIEGSSFALTANTNSDSTFTGWSGCPSLSGNSCTGSMGTSDINVTATFTIKPKVDVYINGCGTVTASGWNCISPGGKKTCNPPLYAIPNTSVTLSANTDNCSGKSHFGSWTPPDCSGSGSCTLTMNGDKKATAYFASQSNCSCDTNDCKSACIGQPCDDSCGNPSCEGTLSCPDWVEVKP